MRNLFVCCFAATIVMGMPLASADELMERARGTFKPIPSQVLAVKGNAITREKIELGKMLFFDPRLSASEIISCNTCHNLGTGGVDAGPTSTGHAWHKGPRRALTVYNAIFNDARFWDGRTEDVKGHAFVEMNVTPDHVMQTLSSMPAYTEAFKKAFPNEAWPVTIDNFAKALEAFEATLITPAARFDQFLEGDATALTAEEKKGLKLFMDKGCSTCHTGINVGGEAYFVFGRVEKPGSKILPRGDQGRFAGTTSDEYVFRVGPLRNVALRAPYFHSGQVWSLKQAVGIMGAAQLGIELTGEEEDAIVAFLHTLTGQQPRIEYPILPVRTEATPEPALK